MGLFDFFKKPKPSFFPNIEDVLVEEYNTYSNFFPIATINLSKYGLDKDMPIVYVFFDHVEQGFKKGDDIDHFSFNYNDKMMLTPSFSETSLELTDDYNEYLQESREKFRQFKVDGDTDLLNEFSSPGWWQDDETPTKLNEQKMKFICEIDTLEFSVDDCRMFVFLNIEEQEIRIVYQRT